MRDGKSGGDGGMMGKKKDLGRGCCFVWDKQDSCSHVAVACSHMHATCMISLLWVSRFMGSDAQ